MSAGIKTMLLQRLPGDSRHTKAGEAGATEQSSIARVPSLFSQERKGPQAVVLCLGLGLYTSRGRSLSSDVGSQLDLAEILTWLSSRVGDRPEPPGWMGLALVALLLWACWEATKFPRHHSMASAWDNVRILMQLLGDFLLAPFFMLMPPELTEVRYAPTPQNEKILASCPSIWRFKQMPWLRNPLLGFAALLWFDHRDNDRSLVHREKLSTQDGGTIALDWWRCSEPGANGKDKVMFIASTWSGESLVSFSREVCKHFTARGFQCVVMVKRGSGLIWPNEQPPREDGTRAKPWCIGGFEDMQQAIDHVAKICPGVPICGLGPSLGGCQLRNYVHATGTKCKLSAAVIVDAADDWNENIESISSRLPLIDGVLRQTADITFDACGAPDARLTEEPPPKGSFYTRMMSRIAGAFATQLRQQPEGKIFKFIRDRQAPAYGFEATTDGAKKYMQSCNAADPAGCAIPTLHLVSFNDFLIDFKVAKGLQKLYQASPNIVTCSTRMGTHVIRWNGLRGSCWISAVSCEFIESALKQQAGQIATDENEVCRCGGA